MMKKKISIAKMLKYEGKQFCLNTALHGYRFIVLPKRILLERIFWVIVVSVSLIAAVTLLVLAWTSFQHYPTILVTDSTHYPIWNYPFPAVTICSFNKISKRRALKIAKNISKPQEWSSEGLAAEFRLLLQAIFVNNNRISNKNYTRLQDIIDVNDETVEGLLRKLSPTCDELLQKCKWKGGEIQCNHIFEQIRTTEGFCCSFNYYARKNHTFSGTLPNKIPKKPRKVSACGYLTALEVLVNSDTDDYFATQVSSIGHQILLHNSYNFPDWSVQNILTEEKIMTMIGVVPTLTYSTDNIRSVQLEKRKCLFSNESFLQNFAKYTHHNCLVECRMNLTKKLCGCIPFYYAHSDTYFKSRTCNLRDISCLAENKNLIRSSVPGYNFDAIAATHVWGYEMPPDCNCLPDCEYVNYVGESSSGIFTRKYSTNQLNLFGNIKINHQSVVRVYFNNLVSIKNRRDVTFSWQTLLAYYGGLLGLFIGFSFISAVEIVYFFTIRLLIDYRKKSKAIEQKQKKHYRNIKPPNYETLNPNPQRLMVPRRFQYKY